MIGRVWFYLSVLVDEVAELDRLPTSGFGVVRAFGGEDDATGRVDDHALATLGFASGDGLLDIATLGADARDEDWHVADDLADFTEFLGARSANDERAVSVLVPLGRHLAGDDLVERFAVHAQILELARAGVGRAAEDNDALVGSREERLECFGSEVRMHGDGVRLQEVEGCIHVPGVRITDVRSLGIQDHQHVRRDGVDVRDRALERNHAFATVCFIERRVRLVCADEVICRLDDSPVELHNCASNAVPACGLRNLAELAVESNAGEVFAIPLVFQKCSKISIAHFTLPLKLRTDVHGSAIESKSVGRLLDGSKKHKREFGAK